MKEAGGGAGPRSMTGFGSAASEVPGLEATASVRSVNHRYLEIGVQLPRRLSTLEPEVRRLVQSRFQRGKVDVRLQVRGELAADASLRADAALVANLVSTLRALKEAHRLAGDVSVSDVARFPGALAAPEAEVPLSDESRSRLLALVGVALDGADSMRLAEGEALRRELGAGLDGVQDSVQRIEALLEHGRAARRQALEQRLREAAAGLGLDEAKLIQEVVRVVERSDVTEELQRLKSHVAQCRAALAGSGPSGKRLDFLAQELHREANTTGSKAVSVEVVQQVVSLKATIERFREQVQNLE
jgi:uncharacterized protein (TIGR00255 family)